MGRFKYRFWLDKINELKTKLYLYDVSEINAQNFMKFPHQRPNLEVFHHNGRTFCKSAQISICVAMAKYCGNRIRDYSGGMPLMDIGHTKEYAFISELKNVKIGELADRIIMRCRFNWCNGATGWERYDWKKKTNKNYSTPLAAWT